MAALMSLVVGAASSFGEIAEIRVPIGIGDGTTSIDADIGVSGADVNLITVSFSGTANHATWRCDYCDSPYHGSNCTDDSELPMHVVVTLYSGSARAYAWWEATADGPFAASQVMVNLNPPAPLFADGTGRFAIEYGAYYQDFQYWCNNFDGGASPLDPGQLSLSGDLVITVEFTPPVAASSESWGYVKARFR